MQKQYFYWSFYIKEVNATIDILSVSMKCTCLILDEAQSTSIEEQLYGRKREESIAEGGNYVMSHYRRGSVSGVVEDKKKLFGVNSSRSVSNSSLKTAVVSDWVLAEETEVAIAEDEQEGKEDAGSSTDNTLEEERDEKLGCDVETMSTQQNSTSMDSSVLQKLEGNLAALPSSTKNSSDETSTIFLDNGKSEDSVTEDKECEIVEITSKVDDTSFKDNPEHPSDAPLNGGAKSEAEKTAPTIAADQQLKLLTLSSRIPQDKKEESSSDKSYNMEYEKLTMEAAALIREKWKQAEKVSD